jgi:NADH-quinone oxidoreductase subunit G
MPVIKIDGKEYEVSAGKNLLQACLELGLDLPYFCWHPAMGSIGACRQCAVVQYQNEEDTRGRIVMGCMTPVTDGAIFSMDGDKASEFRQAIVESLMLNHPHDCPVCAEGGECHLQDMTVMVGHRDRTYRGTKNTHRNQQLGPLINHEMNRCITCYRCTRYYQDYAGGTDLAAMASHDHTYFGRHESGTLESPFAGNLVEVCPTGVFTDKSLVHEYTRKWDLQSAPSVCVGCAVGCNTLPGERYGKLKRIHNRYNRDVNGYFLCDRGRFGGQFVNREDRLNQAGSRQPDGTFQVVDTNAALAMVADKLKNKRIAAIGSPRASLESNYLLQKLVGSENFCSGIDTQEQELLRRIVAHLASSPAHNPSLRDIESADAILVLGENITHTAPRVALALRQSVRNKAFELAAQLRLETWQDAAIRNLAQDQRSPLHIVASGSTDLDDVAASTTYLTADDQVLLAQDLARALAGDTVQTEHLQQIARDLKSAKRPLVICGTAAGSAALIDAAASIATLLSTAGNAAMLSFCLPECNSMGSALLTMEGSGSLEELASSAKRGEIDTLIVMENELHRRCHTGLLQQLRDNIECVIGLDCLESMTLAECDLVLPAAGFTESEATLVSSEGRAQRSFPAHPAAHDRRASWQWLLEIAAVSGREDFALLDHFDDICAACAADHPLVAGIAEAAPDHTFRSHGLKIPRQTHRYSGRTSMQANLSVHEPKQTVDQESALCYTMEGASSTDRPGALLTYMWSPGWNSNQSLHKFQSEVGGSLRGGTAGVRLLDGASLAAPAAAATPPAFAIRSGEFLLQARHAIFGSDEMSSRCSSISQLAGAAFIELNGSDAALLGVSDGDGVTLCQISLEVRINSSIPKGSAGFSAGYSACAELRSGQWAPLSKDENWQHRHPQIISTDRGAEYV